MFSGTLATILNWLGGKTLDKVLGHLEARANSETERQRIQSMRDQHMATTQASVITAGMAYRPFWVVWLMFSVPLALWWIAVMLDTILNGGLPWKIAEIPPQLVPWASAIFQNLFFSGASVGAASIIGRAISERRK